jgi:hypothetical protein
MEHLRIDLVNHGDGTSKGIWTLTFTATSEKGNNYVAQIPDGEPPFLEELKYFLVGEARLTTDYIPIRTCNLWRK